MAQHIFAYHAVEDGFELSATTVPLRRWREHCRFLSDLGWRAVRVDEMIPGADDGTFCITVDDAYTSLLDVVAACERHGWRGTVFVPTGYVGKVASWDVGAWRAHRHLDWEGLRDVAAAGWEIGIHGHTHTALTDKPIVAARQELQCGLAAVEQELGVVATSLAYPFGAASKALAEMAQAIGFRRAVTMEPSQVEEWHSPLLLPRWPVYRMDTAAHLQARLRGAPWLKELERARLRTIQRFSQGTRVRMSGKRNIISDAAEQTYVE